MKSFKEHLITEEIESLFEASIQEPKYANGSLVVLKQDKFETYKNAVGGAYMAKPEHLYRKIDLTPDGIPIGKVNDKPFVSLEVIETPDSKTPLATVTWYKNPSTHYNHLKQSEGINWGKSTNALETVQCIGVYYKGNSEFNTIESRKKVTAKIKSILDNGQDWDANGKALLLDKIDSMPEGNFAEMMDLIIGMQEFVEAMVTFKPLNIIHGKIDDYYKAEESNETLELTGTKANTADMIISNVPADKLIELLKTNAVKHANGICSIGKTKFIQVSLKKSKGGAQLGKVTSDLLGKYNIPSYLDIYQQVVESTYLPEHREILEEGLFDVVKKGISYAKDIWNKLTGLVTKFFSKTQKSLKGIYKDNAKRTVAKFAADLGLSKSEAKALIECLHRGFDNDNLLIEKATKESLYDKLARSIQNRTIDKLTDSVGSRTAYIVKTYDQFVYLERSDGIKTSLKKVPKNKFNPDIAVKLLANEVSLLTLEQLLVENSSDISTLVDNIVAIQKEVYFGKTSLPMFKVYGKFSDAKSYEYLGNAAEFADKKANEIGANPAFPISGLTMVAQDGLYYNIDLLLISGIDQDDNPKYDQFRLGTNASGRFSFTIEGVKTIDFKQYKKKLGK